MNYYLSCKLPNKKYIYIQAVAENIDTDTIEIQLPAWRPGRYEIGNFAKNVRNFVVKDSKNEDLEFYKITKDRWKVTGIIDSKITIEYEYFSNELNAGSTYIDDDLIYINPVNCLVYIEGKTAEKNQLFLEFNDIENKQIATSLSQNDKTIFEAENFDELADSPIMAASFLNHEIFEIENVKHHIWIYGNHTLDIDNFTKNVKQYTQESVAFFEDFPCKDYHYLILALPHKFRHGVEHSKSTVIALGPGEHFNTPEYTDSLLAICCHELFHFWNVKRIRPESMLPYDYTQENYSSLGYIYEGITTYYGDYLLLRSGVWDFDKWAANFNGDMQKHFENEARYFYSVADSSFDTWLDGYVPGAPARKVSIYTEGMLAALMLDIEIRYATNHQKSLDDVMYKLYHDLYKNGKGYTRQSFKNIMDEVAGKDMSFFVKDFYNGKNNIEKFLPETLWSLGLEIFKTTNPFVYKRYFGFTTTKHTNEILIHNIAIDSPAEQNGIAYNQIIIAANGQEIHSEEDLEKVAKNDFGKPLTLKVKDIFREKEIVMQPSTTDFYTEYSLKKMLKTDENQKTFFEKWSKHKF